MSRGINSPVTWKDVLAILAVLVVFGPLVWWLAKVNAQHTHPAPIELHEAPEAEVETEYQGYYGDRGIDVE